LGGRHTRGGTPVSRPSLLVSLHAPLTRAPPQVSIGMKLYPGDFLFMDGEDADWAARRRKAHFEQQRLQETVEDSEESAGVWDDAYRELFAAKLRDRELLRSSFGMHRNILIATTRVEVCLVPMENIAQNQDVFRGLLKIAAAKYSLLALPDEGVIRKYHENRVWALQKAKLLTKNLSANASPRDPSTTLIKKSSKTPNEKKTGDRSGRTPLGGSKCGRLADDRFAPDMSDIIDEEDIDLFDESTQTDVGITEPIQPKLKLLNHRRRSPPKDSARSSDARHREASASRRAEFIVDARSRATEIRAPLAAALQLPNRNMTINERIKSFVQATNRAAGMSPQGGEVDVAPVPPSEGRRTNHKKLSHRSTFQSNGNQTIGYCIQHHASAIQNSLIRLGMMAQQLQSEIVSPPRTATELPYLCKNQRRI
jgi:hypothetical protein